MFGPAIRPQQRRTQSLLLMLYKRPQSIKQERCQRLVTQPQSALLIQPSHSSTNHSEPPFCCHSLNPMSLLASPLSCCCYLFIKSLARATSDWSSSAMIRWHVCSLFSFGFFLRGIALSGRLHILSAETPLFSPLPVYEPSLLCTRGCCAGEGVNGEVTAGCPVSLEAVAGCVMYCVLKHRLFVLWLSGELLQGWTPSCARQRCLGCSRATFHLSSAPRRLRLTSRKRTKSR